MSNTVWTTTQGWHDGPEVPRPEVVERLAGPRRTLAMKDRVDLVQQTDTPITLDGHPAVISGYRNDFATIQRKDGTGGKVEFSWITAWNIVVNRNGDFRS